MPHCPNESFSGLGRNGQGDWAINPVSVDGCCAPIRALRPRTLMLALKSQSGPGRTISALQTVRQLLGSGADVALGARGVACVPLLLRFNPEVIDDLGERHDRYLLVLRRQRAHFAEEVAQLRCR